MKTHFRMPWYGAAICGSHSEQHSAKPAEVTCAHCRRWNLSERSKQSGPPTTVVHSVDEPAQPFIRNGFKSGV